MFDELRRHIAKELGKLAAEQHARLRARVHAKRRRSRRQREPASRAAPPPNIAAPPRALARRVVGAKADHTRAASRARWSLRPQGASLGASASVELSHSVVVGIVAVICFVDNCNGCIIVIIIIVVVVVVVIICVIEIGKKN